MFESKETKEMIKLMVETLKYKKNEYFIVVLLEGSDEPAVITSSMLGKPFDSYIDTRYTHIWNKKLNRILGIAYTQDQADAIKLNYECSKHKEYYYVVTGEYPNLNIDKREYVSEDNYNYCLRRKQGNLDLINKERVFETFEQAVEFQTQKIQQKDRLGELVSYGTLTLNDDNRISTINPKWEYTCNCNHKENTNKNKKFTKNLKK